jgi:hypothetical protein
VTVVLATVCAATAAVTLAVLSCLSRFRFRRRPGAFRCRLGPPARSRWHGVPWRIRRTRAVWVENVLLVQSGALRLGVTPLAVQLPLDATVEPIEPFTVRGLGVHVVALRLTADDGRQLVVATSIRDRTALVGPFLAAAVPGMPSAPRERGV